MKTKANAKQKREAEALKRRELLSPKKKLPAEPLPAKPAIRKPESLPQLLPEEETMLFLEYLEKHDNPVGKEDMPESVKNKGRQERNISSLNLEEGMPVVSEAVSRMQMGIQEFRISRIRVVKLIHGYGSTGRGGKICTGVRNELAAMKRKKQIRDFIPGEDFGPVDTSSRKLAETDKTITRDPDYGRMNHGITIVVL